MTDALLPHLRLVHRFPQCFARVQCDRGAVRFVLSGATLMAPGLTSPGGKLPKGDESDPDLEAGTPVVVMAEGKEEACSVGLLSMGTKEVKEKGKGPVIEEGHFLGDGLWKLNTE
jgi:PUA domain protein